MDCQRIQYKQKIMAWNAFSKDQKNHKTWTLNESHQFDNKKACIPVKDFKEGSRNGYDFKNFY